MLAPAPVPVPLPAFLNAGVSGWRSFSLNPLHDLDAFRFWAQVKFIAPIAQKIIIQAMPAQIRSGVKVEDAARDMSRYMAVTQGGVPTLQHLVTA